VTDGGVARHTPPQPPLGRRGRGIVLPSAHPIVMRRMLPLLLIGTLACTAARQSSAVAPGRQSPHARAADSAELLRLHENARAAHLQRRADLLVADHADSMFSLSRGSVSIGRRAEVQAMFQGYLDSVTFQAWDDIVPPRIRISADGQMAYVVVQKRVHLTQPGPGGTTLAERVRYAWLSVYEKRDGRWTLTAIASTERPDSL